MTNKKICRHCEQSYSLRSRSLCWRCYNDKSIRGNYRSTSKFAARGLRDFCGGHALPDQPTKALPGTPEKVEVLMQRAQAGVSLWHPLDAVHDGTIIVPSFLVGQEDGEDD